jgi:hypothetical protein
MTAEQVREAALQLLGMPLGETWRAANMQIFEFGPGREGTNRRGQLIRLPDWALHVQCAWRLLCGGALFVGSADLQYPADREADPLKEFDWDNEPDRRSAILLNVINGTTRLAVREVDLLEAGTLDLTLSDSYRLQVFPDSSYPETEHWRLLSPAWGGEHYVCSSNGFSKEREAGGPDKLT